MKKIIAFLALICIISTLALTGCSSFTREIIEFVELPDQYYIEYEVVGDDGTVKTIARGRDANGNYYYRASGVETIYLIDGEYYTAYDMSDGEYIVREDRVKESLIKEETNAFETYSNKSMETISGVYDQVEGSELFGRECDNFTLSLNILIYVQSYTMAVDRESGVCLSFWGTSTVLGMETAKNGFECVSFETEDVDLPSVIK